MAKLKGRKLVAKTGSKKASPSGRLASSKPSGAARRKTLFRLTVSKSVPPETNSKPGSPLLPTEEPGAKNGNHGSAEALKSQSGLDLTEKVKELVRLAQEQGYLTYSDINDALPDSVVSPEDAIVAVQRLGAPHAINVKLMKSGVVGALNVVAVARAGGMSLMIGGMLESSLAMSASACFASGLGGFEFVDLDTPLFLVGSPFRGGFALRADVIDVSVIGEGHGVFLAPDRAEPLIDAYLAAGIDIGRPPTSIANPAVKGGTIALTPEEQRAYQRAMGDHIQRYAKPGDSPARLKGIYDAAREQARLATLRAIPLSDPRRKRAT